MRPATRSRIEDVEFLLAAGDSPLTVCTRMGTNPVALSRMLYRNGRADLAREFTRLAWLEHPRRRRPYREAFPRKHAAAAAWSVANGWPLASCGRVTRAAYDAWEQAQQDNWTEAA